MNITFFMIALLAASVFTSLITEAIKKMLGDNAPSSNVLVAIVSVVTGIALSTGYILYTATPISVQVVITSIALVILSWLCAMVGYDKVVQAIKQIAGK